MSESNADTTPTVFHGEVWIRQSQYQELQRRLFSVEDAVIEPYCDELEARAEQAEQTRDKLAERVRELIEAGGVLYSHLRTEGWYSTGAPMKRWTDAVETALTATQAGRTEEDE